MISNNVGPKSLERLIKISLVAFSINTAVQLHNFILNERCGYTQDANDDLIRILKGGAAFFILPFYYEGRYPNRSKIFLKKKYFIPNIYNN